MKIIKEGKLEKKVKCSYCECEFEYDVEDIKEDHVHSFDCIAAISKGKQRFVRCPECGNKIKVRLHGENNDINK